MSKESLTKILTKRRLTLDFAIQPFLPCHTTIFFFQTMTFSQAVIFAAIIFTQLQAVDCKACDQSRCMAKYVSCYNGCRSYRCVGNCQKRCKTCLTMPCEQRKRSLDDNRDADTTKRRGFRSQRHLFIRWVVWPWVKQDCLHAKTAPSNRREIVYMLELVYLIVFDWDQLLNEENQPSS